MDTNIVMALISAGAALLKWLGMLYVQKENKIYYLKGDSFECLSWSKVQTLSS